MAKDTGADPRGGFKVVGTGETAQEAAVAQPAATASEPSSQPRALRPKIIVLGLGGAGGNAVHNMIEGQLEGVDLFVANTDSQALEGSICTHRLQLGRELTGGLGAGGRPEVGRAAAEESLDEILTATSGASLVFIAAGMGGGTGTGSAPVVAEAIRKKGILTVAVVTKPFRFEGELRMEVAEEGIEALEQHVDTLIVIPNQNLFKIATEKTSVADAFHRADNVLFAGVRGVTDLMVKPGLINLDFADFRSVMTQTGKAIMGAGEADGPQRAVNAAEAAMANPLLEDSTVDGARGVLINVTGGPDLTLFELDEAVESVRAVAHPKANIIVGSAFDEDLEGKIRVSVLATGIRPKEAEAPAAKAEGSGQATATSPAAEATVPAAAEAKAPKPVVTEPAAPEPATREPAARPADPVPQGPAPEAEAAAASAEPTAAKEVPEAGQAGVRPTDAKPAPQASPQAKAETAMPAAAPTPTPKASAAEAAPVQPKGEAAPPPAAAAAGPKAGVSEAKAAAPAKAEMPPPAKAEPAAKVEAADAAAEPLAPASEAQPSSSAAKVPEARVPEAARVPGTHAPEPPAPKSTAPETSPVTAPRVAEAGAGGTAPPSSGRLTLEDILRRAEQAMESTKAAEATQAEAPRPAAPEPAVEAAPVAEPTPNEAALDDDANLDALIDEVLIRNRKTADIEPQEPTLKMPPVAEPPVPEPSNTSTDALLEDLAFSLASDDPFVLDEPTPATAAEGKAVEARFGSSAATPAGPVEDVPAAPAGQLPRDAEDAFQAELDRRARERARAALEALSSGTEPPAKPKAEEEESDEALREVMNIPSFLRRTDD